MLREQVSALAFPMGEDVLNSDLKGLLDAAASDEVLTESSPTLSHPLHSARICISDHFFHLVHVVLESEFRTMLFCEALVWFDVLEAVDSLSVHFYSPLAPT
ncbi:hypothetical protein [Streptomyces sp. enrichment culture]|uniref:hypothetical protein n=1 Tax=Streptomyces sp. enrichment culture TaxID=1795815 RepID=UPI003F54A330